MVVVKYEHSTASDGWPDWSLESVHDLMSRNVWKCELTLNNALQSGILITLPRFPVTRSLHIFVTGVWIKSCQAAMKYLKPDSQIIFIEIQKGALWIRNAYVILYNAVEEIKESTIPSVM